MIPITRKELYLNKIVGNDDYSVPEKPISEEEFFFAEILGEAVQAPEPLTRYQMYLAKIAGREIEIPYPKVRLEYFLAKSAGMDVETPTPITREEMFWADYALIVEKELSGIPPLTFNAVAGTLKNYRIYGNTVNGESVGDRTANLIQGSIKNANIGNNGKINTSNEFILVYAPVVTGESYTISNNNGTNVYAFYNAVPSTETVTSYDSKRQIFSTSTITFVSPITGYIAVRLANTAQDIMINPGSTALPYEPYGYKVPVTVEGKNLFDGNFLQGYWAYADGKFVYTSTWICTTKIPCTGGQMYTYSFSKVSRWFGFVWYDGDGDYISANNLQDGSNTQYRLYCATAPSNATYMAINIAGYPAYNSTILPSDITDFMLVAGEYTSETMPNYEPYHAPVTTPIYLPEPIKMVGDEAEYIDYAEQKQYFADGTETDVTLPALPTLAGTNVLSVGTAVQPSKVYVKYKGERQ